MLSKYLLIILTLLCVAFSAQADDQSGHGFYGLLGLGRGYNHFSANNFTDAQTYDGNKWNFAGRLALGFNIDHYIGIELGGRYGKERKFSNIQDSGTNGTIDQHAYTAQTVIRWPFADGFNLLAKFGPAYIETDKKIDSNSAQGIHGGSIRHWQPMYSLGATMDLDGFPGLSLLAEYSSIVGDHEKQLPDSDLYIVGFVFHF